MNFWTKNEDFEQCVLLVCVILTQWLKVTKKSHLNFTPKLKLFDKVFEQWNGRNIFFHSGWKSTKKSLALPRIIAICCSFRRSLRKWDFLSDFKTLCFCPFLLSCFLFCHKFSPLHFWGVLTWCLLYESFKKHFRFLKIFQDLDRKKLFSTLYMWPLWFHYDNFHKLVIEASRLLSWYGSLHHSLLW